MSLYVPTSPKECRALTTHLQDPIEREQINIRLQDPTLKAEVQKLVQIMVDIFTDPIKRSEQLTQSVPTKCYYYTSGVTAKLAQLAETYQVPVWHITANPQQSDYPDWVQLRDFGWVI